MPKSKKKNSSLSFKKLQSKTSSQLPTALVAGAAGFIGSHLCNVLIQQNCQVYGLDNWVTGKKENIKPLLKKKNFCFIEHDLNKPLKSSIPQVDYIFHLAGIEAYLDSQDVSLENLLVNSLGTRELLEIARKHQAKFLLASSVDVFSGFMSSSNLKQYFGSEPQKQELYSHHESKRFSEAITFEYVDRYHLDARVVRLAGVYGPKMNLASGNEIAKLFFAARNNQPLQVKGDGLKPLYPTYISDIVYGITKAMFSQSSNGQIFTLINPEKTSVLNFAYKLQQIHSDKKLEIKFVPGNEDLDSFNVSSQVLDSQQNLGWVPKINIEEGISLTLKWLVTGKAAVTAVVDQPLVSTKPSRLQTYTAAKLNLQPAPAPLELVEKLKIKKTNKFKLSVPHLKKPRLPKFNLSFRLPFKTWTRRTKIAILIAVSLLLWLVGPILLMTGYIYTGAQSLKKASQLTDFTQFDQVEKLTVRAYRNFEKSRGLLGKSQSMARLLGMKQEAANLDSLLFIASQLSQGALHLTQAGETGTFLTEIIFHHQSGNLTEALKRIQVDLDQAYTEFSFVESELQSGKELDSDLTTPLFQKIHLATADLPDLRKKINQARLVLPIVPSLIAQDSKKVYLLLFQNNAEIRPTGGFIGSYGLLTFEKGKLLDFVVEDIYAADGQLQGYVEPPEPIEKYLGQNSWYFRDSNWNPDFTVSAPRAEWFLQKTTNRSVDGVIAVNLPAIKELLQATGPIQITDYNEEITAANLFEKAEYHSEIDFFPGSTQKKDFLGALARELFDQLQNASAADILKLVRAIEDGLLKKQILVNLHDAGSQQLLLEQNWAGAIFNPLITTPGTVRPVTADYTFLVEANLGINKSNYFLERDIQHQLTILKNKEILVVTTINYDNQSPADAWPGGIYRSYLRDYLPKEAQPIAITVGDQKLNLEEDVDITVEGDKKVLGFPVTVPVKNSLEVEITYRLPDKIELTQQQGRLAVIIGKQPGIIADKIEVIINYPSFLNVVGTTPTALTSPQVITWQSNQETDRVFIVDFVEN